MSRFTFPHPGTNTGSQYSLGQDSSTPADVPHPPEGIGSDQPIRIRYIQRKRVRDIVPSIIEPCPTNDIQLMRLPIPNCQCPTVRVPRSRQFVPPLGRITQHGVDEDSAVMRITDYNRPIVFGHRRPYPRQSRT